MKLVGDKVQLWSKLDIIISYPALIGWNVSGQITMFLKINLTFPIRGKNVRGVEKMKAKERGEEKKVRGCRGGEIGRKGSG